jgi:glycine/D-amino acid oxidase-like deaminating enzyme/nitrite reductase/ring-hydroxylating ferredoxin subunit
MPRFGQLDRNEDVDVVVVGGGITGFTTAYLLAHAGRSVAIVERGRCGDSDTNRTSAHLTMVTDARLRTLSRRFGRTHAQAAWDAGLAAIAEIDRLVRELGIDCSFEWVEGYLHAPDGKPNDDEADALAQEAALASDLGFDATFVDEAPFVGGPGIRFENQARFHPRRYLAGLAGAVRAKGVHIFEQSSADEFRWEPPGIRANRHWLRCSDIVMATHNPLVGMQGTAGAAVLQTKLALYTSYVIAALAPRGAVPDALFWDTADPYRYLRIERHGDHDLIVAGGEDHKTGQESDTASRHERLERGLLSRIPDASPTHRWSGQVIQTPDGLPYIGQVADHQFVATGFNGNGLTFGTVSAMIVSDLILGRVNPWVKLFAPDRSALRGLWNYIRENADYPYYLMRDRFAGAEGRSARTVKRGQGKIIERNGTKVAAYRDASGALTLLSAACTHMGCTVAWNEAERSWDCPCHGSRFTPEGDVIGGPAESPLAPVQSR